MVALSRSLTLVAAALAGVEAARSARMERPSRNPTKTKMISGVPVHNYDNAFNKGRWDQSFLESLEGRLEDDQEHWIAALKRGVSESELLRVCSAHAECEVHGDVNGFPFVEFTASEKKLAAILAEEGDVIAHVEPNMPVWATPEIGATEAKTPWGIRRIRSRSLSSMPAEDPGPANGGQGVNVYVLDTGVRTSHNEFQGRAEAAIEVTLSLFVKDCNSLFGGGSCAQDDHGHGSHCAGTIAGANYGVAKGATIHSAKVLSSSGAGNMIGIANAINWVARNRVLPAVASMSLGGGFLQTLNNAVDSLSAAGVTVVTASGNSNADGCGFSPGSAVRAINVGSLDPNDARSSFSNYGSCLDIWAPGRNILSSVHTGDDASATYSGTSMACPHVSGAAAIILQGSPSLTPAQVKERLIAAATPDLVTDARPNSPNLMLYSPPSGATSLANCNSNDYAVMDALGTDDFATKMQECGVQALNFLLQWKPDKFVSCARGVGLSAACANCYEDAGKYGFDNCKIACFNGLCSDECLDCTGHYTETLEQCVGRVFQPPSWC